MCTLPAYIYTRGRARINLCARKLNRILFMYLADFRRRSRPVENLVSSCFSREVRIESRLLRRYLGQRRETALLTWRMAAAFFQLARRQRRALI